MLKYRKKKAELLQYVQENKEYFGNIDQDSYNALRVMLGSEQCLKIVEKKSGGIDMCKALDDLYQDGVAEGGAKVIVTMIRKKINKGMTSSEIASELELEVSYVQKIAGLMEEDSQRTDLQIAELIMGNL